MGNQSPSDDFGMVTNDDYQMVNNVDNLNAKLRPNYEDFIGDLVVIQCEDLEWFVRKYRVNNVVINTDQEWKDDANKEQNELFLLH